MSIFKRGLQPQAVASLRRLSDQSGHNWWKDLLGLWEPSGRAAETNGLRLAIRNNYLNFYSRGQSVARVGFTPDCTPYVSTHVKYVSDCAVSDKTRVYARLEGRTISHPQSGEQLRYEGESTLHQWIARTVNHAGTEKENVDTLVADNASIIDLEMGLPAAGEQTSALRMDCVALERGGNAIQIVFWEAKMIYDSRLRSRTDPEVVNGQVKPYRIYLADSDRARGVETAYREVCSLLLELGRMAALLGKEINIHELILEAAEEGSNLTVDPEPRLVIFGGRDAQKGNWPHHEGRLWTEFKIPYLLFEDMPFRLRRPEMLG